MPFKRAAAAGMPALGKRDAPDDVDGGDGIAGIAQTSRKFGGSGRFADLPLSLQPPCELKALPPINA